MKNVGLVLEGGGMRGVYTAGVLEYFLDQGLFFPYIVGVSAGACNGASYVSRQKGRNYQVTIGLVNHPDYISYKNLFTKKELFGMKFIFHDVPKTHVPFDYETFAKVPQKFFIGATDCHTGKPVYFEKSSCIGEDLSNVLQASSSLPLMAPVVTYNGMDLLDGGISDPIPIKKAISDGFEKSVVILTRNLGYQKEKQRFGWMFHRLYRNYPKIVEAMQKRHENYNSTLKFIEEEEKKGKLFVFRPSIPLKVGRIERNKEKLTKLYELGYNDGKALYPKLINWLKV